MMVKGGLYQIPRLRLNLLQTVSKDQQGSRLWAPRPPSKIRQAYGLGETARGEMRGRVVIKQVATSSTGPRMGNFWGGN